MVRRIPQEDGLTPDIAMMFGAIALFCSISDTPAFSADLSELPPQFQEKVEVATKTCANFENGEFDLEWGAVDRVDLDGDLYHDWVLNECRGRGSLASEPWMGFRRFWAEQGPSCGCPRVTMRWYQSDAVCDGEHLGQRKEKVADDWRGMGVASVTCLFSPPAIPSELIRKAARP